MDRYVVIGHPVSHSLSPHIHARFAQSTGQSLEYATLEAPLDAFAATAKRFFAEGGRGANVTLPFKVEAFELAEHGSDRARLAGAANFLALREGRIEADNTDGAGLVADLERLGAKLEGARVLLLGAGGAARGVIAPVLARKPALLVIANRTAERAEVLARRFADRGAIEPASLARRWDAPFDIVVNATSTSTKGEAFEVPPGAVGHGTLAYDMAYGASAQRFLAAARALGARAEDGLGMLVEQAAESFLLWRGVRPATGPVLAELRKRIA